MRQTLVTGIQQIWCFFRGLAVGFWSFLRRRRSISGGKARKLVLDGASLLDVRTSDEFSENRLPGAINIPITELSRRYHELSVEKPIVVYCEDGQRSRRAIRLLGRVKTVHAYNLGAMRRWKRKRRITDNL